MFDRWGRERKPIRKVKDARQMAVGEWAAFREHDNDPNPIFGQVAEDTGADIKLCIWGAESRGYDGMMLVPRDMIAPMTETDWLILQAQGWDGDES